MLVETPISILSLDVNLVKLPNKCDYYGPEEGYPFWLVTLDENVLSTTCMPFASHDFIIEVYGSMENTYWGDGNGMVSVRAIGDYILWCRPFTSYLDEIDQAETRLQWSALNKHTYYFFDKFEYLKTVTSFYERYDKPTNHKINRESLSARLPKHLEDTQLTEIPVAPPKLHPIELRELLSELLVNRAESYRFPQSSKNCSGEKLKAKLVKAIINSPTVEIVIPPKKWIEYRLTYHFSKDGPCIFRVGYTDQQRIAIQFVSNPGFPLWLCGTEFDIAFQDEDILRSL